MDKLIVMKFGGSCLQDIDSFKKTVQIIKSYINDSHLIVVTSALKGITDKLIEFYGKSCEDGPECQNLLDEIYEKHYEIIDGLFVSNAIERKETVDYLRKNVGELGQLGRVVKLLRPSMNIQDIIVSYGERLSTYLLSQYLNSIGLQTFFQSSDEIILTDDNFGNALPFLDESEKLIQEKLIPLIIDETIALICVTGYYGSTKDGKITTLGRGATDLTAGVLAYSLREHYSCKVIYWKDVKGFLNADPNIAEKTTLLKNLSYIEAKELAFFGSKVLHPLCLDVNERGNIPSEIHSFFDPDSDEYTIISKEINHSSKKIKAITSIYKLSMVTIESGTMISLPGTVYQLFSLLWRNNINVKFISQSSSENNITFGIDPEDSMNVSFILRNSELFGKQWFSIKIENDVSLIAIIGAGMKHTPGIAGMVFTTLGENGINVRAIAQGSSELNITAIIDRENCKKAVNVLYDAFVNHK